MRERGRKIVIEEIKKACRKRARDCKKKRERERGRTIKRDKLSVI